MHRLRPRRPNSVLVANRITGFSLGFNRLQWFKCTICGLILVSSELLMLGLLGFLKLAHAVLVKAELLFE